MTNSTQPPEDNNSAPSQDAEAPDVQSHQELETQAAQAEADGEMVAVVSAVESVEAMRRATDDPTIDEAHASPVMRRAYIDYSMSVITERSLPDVRDGLKPVHRRILWAMQEAGNVASHGYRKAARTVGDVIGKYHPHGDTSVYDAAVRMAQDFSMAIPLIDGQGNFGSIDGDNPAAMRYTEMRLARVATDIFADIGKETVFWAPNYDGTEREPSVLPMPFPNLLVNGGEGIAVGMASKIPPHNLREVCEVTKRLIHEPGVANDVLLRLMQGPDFPTHALVHSMDGYAQAFESGRGAVKVRARWHEEERSHGSMALVIDELPYQVNKAKLVSDIADLVRKKTIDGITDLRDESNKEGLRIYIALRRDVSPEVVFAELTARTEVEVSFSYNVVALDNGRPRQMGLREVMELWIAFRREVVLARYIFDRKKARAREHILAGYLAALGALDAVIQTIRQAPGAVEARERLMALLSIDEEQAQAVLDLRLQKLTSMETAAIRTEHEQVLAKIAELTDVIESPAKIDAIICDELDQVADRHGWDRRTEVAYGLSSITREDLIERENVLITMTKNGYVKRLPATALQSQNRGTRGKSAITVDEDDTLTFLQEAFSHDTLMVFTRTGQVHALKAYQIPEGNLASRGRHIKNVIDGLEDEIVAVLSVAEKDDTATLMTVTAQAQVKRTLLSEYDGASRKGGVRGVGIDESDELIAAFVAHDEDQVLLVSRAGQAIRFKASDARSMGRAAGGVRGMKIGLTDRLVGAAVINGREALSKCLLCVGELGVGKRTIISDFPLQGRAGSGVVAFKESRKTGPLVTAMAVSKDEDLVMLASNGVSNRVHVEDIRETGRSASGVILMNLDAGATLVSATAAVRIDDDGEGAEKPATDEAK